MHWVLIDVIKVYPKCTNKCTNKLCNQPQSFIHIQFKCSIRVNVRVYERSKSTVIFFCKSIEPVF